VAKLFNRFGQRLGTFTQLTIDYPITRSGTRFAGSIPSASFCGIDPGAVRYFVVQDDGGNRYTAVIHELSPAPDDATCLLISGAVVAGGQG
jgi:hypothetical protein